MLYFSELRGKHVIENPSVFIGTLEDIVFKATPSAPVSKILVKTPKNHRVLIPYSSILKMGKNILISPDYVLTNLEENELYVGKNLNDQQIIDVRGNKMVRVNDVVFLQKPFLHLSGVDIGWIGLMRWIGMEKFVRDSVRLTGKEVTSEFLSWNDIMPVELARGRVMLKKQETSIAKLRPEDLADYLNHLSLRNAKRLLHTLDDEFAASVIKSLNVYLRGQAVRVYTPERLVRILDHLDIDEVVDVLLSSDRHLRERILKLIPPPRREEVLRLFKVARTPVGDLMNIQFLVASPVDTVGKIIRQIRKEAAQLSDIKYIYVVNDAYELIGVFSLLELLSESIEEPVYKFMITNPVTASLSTPKEIILKKMIKYKIDSLPIVDDRNHLVGVVGIVDVVKPVNQ
ncbi:MAG: CBS domain-containing protein [Patescibacteria group bacterium]